MGEEDEGVGADDLGEACGAFVPPAGVDDEGSPEAPARRDHARVVRSGASSSVPDEGAHAVNPGQVVAQGGQVGVLRGVQVRPPHSRQAVIARACEAGHRPGCVHDHRFGRSAILPRRSLDGARPRDHSREESAPPLLTRGTREEAHDARRSQPSGDPGHHPHGAVPPLAPGGLGDEGDDERAVPGQAHLSPAAHAHAGHERGNGSSRRGEDEGGARGVLAQARSRHGDGLARVVGVGRGQAHEGDEARAGCGVRVHSSTVRAGGTRVYPHARPCGQRRCEMTPCAQKGPTAGPCG